MMCINFFFYFFAEEYYLERKKGEKRRKCIRIYKKLMLHLFEFVAQLKNLRVILWLRVWYALTDFCPEAKL